MIPLTFAAATDVGQVRPRNEDRWGANPGHGLFIVSDGMGGAAHGELAAQIVVDALPTHVEKQQRPIMDPGEVLRAALASLSDEMHTRSRSARLSGTSATAVVALIIGKRCAIGHLGDSRAYLARGGQVTCLTTDHTVAQTLIDAGEISIAELATHPSRNTLTRFVGMPPPARPQVTLLDLRALDRILLCSDGVSGALDGETLEAVVGRDEAADVLCNLLIDAANRCGGRDNSTALVIEIGYETDDLPNDGFHVSRTGRA